MITSTGVGSGLDVNQIVSSLMAVEQRPLTLLQQREATIQTRISAYGATKASLASLGDVAAKIATPANWNPLKADSSDSAAVGVTADSKAAAGKHRLEVQRLAQGQVLQSAAFASSAAAVGTGMLKIELGTTSAGAFTAKDGASPVEITIGSDKQTLADVRDAINAAKAGVTASIVNTGSGARLILRGADGAENSVRITATDDDGNATDAAGLSALAHDPAQAAGAGRNMTENQLAQDAQFTLDGVPLTSATNTPSTVLDGVTFTLKKETTGPVDLTISVDSAALRKNVNDFVNAYNNLTRLLKQQTQADPSGKTRGPLQGDSTAVSLLNSLRNQLRGSVAGMAGGVDSLNTAGMELTRDGTLAIDEKRFGKLLEEPARLAKLFSQPEAGGDAGTQGFGVRFQAWAKALTADGGALDNRVDGLQDGVKANQKQQDAQQERLARTEARIRAQYQRLDTEMNRLNAQMAQMRSSLGIF